MGLSRFVRLSALILTLLTTLVGFQSVQAQDVQGGSVHVQFSMDTLPIAVGVLCQGQQYKILIQPSQILGNTRRQLHSAVEVGAALNPIAPTYIDLPAGNPEAIFTYDAQNLGQDTVAYTAYQKTKLASDAGAQPVIGEGSLSFEVKQCLYTVTMVYAFEFPLGTVFGLMADAQLAMNKDGTFDGDGPFTFQQMVAVAPCVATFVAVIAPTHIHGTLDKTTHKLTLDFKYSKTQTTIDASCPIVGKASASKSVDPASLGVPKASFPEEGGDRTFPALGGKLTIIVNQELK